MAAPGIRGWQTWHQRLSAAGFGHRRALKLRNLQMEGINSTARPDSTLTYSFLCNSGRIFTLELRRRISAWSGFVLALVLSLWSQAAYADGILMIDQDAIATGRGDAFVATADNPSAMDDNPAGITQLDGYQLRLGTYGLTYQTGYTAPSGVGFSSQREFTAMPQFYYTFTPTNFPLAFGLGVYSPFRLSMKWPETSGFRSMGLESRSRI